MATPRQVINDLRAWAAHFDGTHLQGHMMDRVVRSLHRGAEVIEQQQAELDLLRAYAEIPQERDAA